MSIRPTSDGQPSQQPAADQAATQPIQAAQAAIAAASPAAPAAALAAQAVQIATAAAAAATTAAHAALDLEAREVPSYTLDYISRARSNPRNLQEILQEMTDRQAPDKVIRFVVRAAILQEGCALEFASESFKDDFMFALEAVTQNGLALQFVSERLRNDPHIVQAAVTQNRLALQFASDALKGHVGIVQAAVTQNGLALQFASDALKGHVGIVRAAVDENGLALQFISENLSLGSNPWNADAVDIMQAALDRNGLALQFIAEFYRDLPHFVQAALDRNGLALQFASERLRNDPMTVLAAVRQNGLALQFASERLRNDPDIIEAALRQNGLALQFANKAFKDHHPSLIAAISDNPLALEFASEALKRSAIATLLAVKKNGLALQFAWENFRNVPQLVIDAVRNNGLGLQFANEELRNDPDIVREAIGQNGLALQFVCEELRNDRGIVEAALKQNGLALQFVSEELRNHPDIVQAAIEQDLMSVKYAGPIIIDDRDFVLECVRRHPLVLKHANACWKNDPDIVLAALKEDPRAIEYAGPVLLSSPDFIAVCARNHADEVIQHVKDRNFVLECVRRHPLALQHANDRWKNDSEIVLAAVQQDSRAIAYAGPELLANPDFIIRYAQYDPYSLDLLRAQPATPRSGLTLQQVKESPLQWLEDIAVRRFPSSIHLAGTDAVAIDAGGVKKQFLTTLMDGLETQKCFTRTSTRVLSCTADRQSGCALLGRLYSEVDAANDGRTDKLLTGPFIHPRFLELVRIDQSGATDEVKLREAARLVGEMIPEMQLTARIIEQAIIQREAFRERFLSGTCTPAETALIPEMWQTENLRLDFQRAYPRAEAAASAAVPSFEEFARARRAEFLPLLLRRVTLDELYPEDQQRLRAEFMRIYACEAAEVDALAAEDIREYIRAAQAFHAGAHVPYRARMVANPVGALEAVQGQALTKDRLLGALTIVGTESEALTQRVEWIRQLIQADTDDLKFCRGFVRCLTGKSVLTAADRIRLSQSVGTVFEVHTCFNSLDFPSEALEEADFKAALKAFVGDDSYNIG